MVYPTFVFIMLKLLNPSTKLVIIANIRCVAVVDVTEVNSRQCAFSSSAVAVERSAFDARQADGPTRRPRSLQFNDSLHLSVGVHYSQVYVADVEASSHTT